MRRTAIEYSARIQVKSHAAQPQRRCAEYDERCIQNDGGRFKPGAAANMDFVLDSSPALIGELCHAHDGAHQVLRTFNKKLVVVALASNG